MVTWKLTLLGWKDAAFGVELLLSRSTTDFSLCFSAVCAREGGSTDDIMPMVPGNALILPSESEMCQKIKLAQFFLVPQFISQLLSY